jgi:environmental stress-induced protein Ves
MKHLTCADYRTMPWANGKGTTVELLRVDGPQGLLWRLSMASVVEDGPFSMLPGIDRNLTVITGPGFRLHGDGIDLTCAPLVPVSFPGDVAVTALDVTAPSDDFNVMTDRALPHPAVTVERNNILPAGGMLALFARTDAMINGTAIARHDLILTDEAAQITGGPVIAVRLRGL